MVELPSRPVAHTPATPDGEWHYLDDHSLTAAQRYGSGVVKSHRIDEIGKVDERFQRYLLAQARDAKDKG